MVNALTIDVEEHFQAHAYERAIARDAWDRQPSRVTTTTRRILVLLAERGQVEMRVGMGGIEAHHAAEGA